MAVVCEVSEYAITSFNVLVGEVLGLRLATLLHLEAEIRPLLKRYESSQLLCNHVFFSTIPISSSEN